MKLSFFPLVIVILFFVGCKQKEKEQPVTTEEARAFAKKLEASIEKKDPTFMDESLAIDVFIKRAGLPAGKKARDFGSGVEQGMKLGTSITKAVSKKVVYHLVKQYEKNGVQHLIFRLYDEGSINYHDIELTKLGKDVLIADMFVYISGEPLSATVGTLYKQMESLMDSKSAAWMDKLTTMKQQVASEQYTDAVDTYNSLPATIKIARAVQMMYLTAASMTEDIPLYNKAIDEYQKLYPNEPNMHLLLLNGYILNKEYDRALEGINAVDKMINTDPFLDYYRYLIFTLKQDNATAKTHLEKLMKYAPDFEDGMLELIATYLEEKDETAAAPWIKKYEENLFFDQDRLKMTIEKYR